MRPYRAELKQTARSLRKGMTDAEHLLWYRLRRKQILNVQVYRQRPLGSYIVDFYAPSVSLVIEPDGAQHSEPTAKARDATRDAWLLGQGLKVLRFDNLQVLKQLHDVLAVIHTAFSAGQKTNPP